VHGGGAFPYAAGDGYEAIEVPYDGDELGMLVIVPKAGTYASFETALTGGKVLDILAGLSNRQVSLAFPKLKMDAGLSLKNSLKQLGMKQAFDGADFSGMSSSMSLVIEDVVHKTFLAVDEDGTEAAAAAGVIVGERAAPMDKVKMTVDRPFITAIVDRQTKTLVFLGRILTPKS